MLDPDVRPARLADVGELAELEIAARTALIGQRGSERWLASNAALEPAGWATRVDAGEVVVAHIDDVVVGFCVVALPAAGGVATIDLVYVRPEARELGFGDELLAAAIERARSTGASWLEGEALPGDRETKNLYERAGIKARLITVSTPL